MSTRPEAATARTLPALSEGRLLRYGAFTGRYVAQGVPGTGAGGRAPGVTGAGARRL